MNRLKTRKPGLHGGLPPAGPPPRPGGAVARAQRRRRMRATPLLRCVECGAIAVWLGLPAGMDAQYCDDCVPRGCSCQTVPDGPHIRAGITPETMPDGSEVTRTACERRKPRQERDGLGRELPCCEFLFRSRGFS